MMNLIIGIVFVAALFLAFGLARRRTACHGHCVGCEQDCKFDIARDPKLGEVTRGQS